MYVYLYGRTVLIPAINIPFYVGLPAAEHLRQLGSQLVQGYSALHEHNKHLSR